MIDILVSGLPPADEDAAREDLETKSWDELTAMVRKHQLGMKIETTKGTTQQTDDEWGTEKPTDEVPLYKGKPEEAGIQVAIDTLVELEKTVGKNYKHALIRALKVLNRLV